MQTLDFERYEPDQMAIRAKAQLDESRRRRSVRSFSPEAIPLGVVRDCIETAAQAPSGANKQPWTFVMVTEPQLKQRIREAAEQEEREFYGGRASERWLQDLEPFETDANKPFLEVAPVLIVVFAQRHGSENEQHYYVQESVGIASGMLLAALHHAGLATLTHTPSPMKFLGEILGRPKSERAYLLIPVGYPSEGCEVPQIERKRLDEVLIER